MMAKHPESKLLNESQIQQELALALVQTFELATYHKGNVLLFNSDSYLIPTKIILIL